MIKMLSRSDPCEHGALEIALLPDSTLFQNVEYTAKAKLAKGCCLLCCLDVDGKLTVADVSESSIPVHTCEGKFIDFAWEETAELCRLDGSPRLLAVNSSYSLTLCVVEAEDLTTAVTECSSDTLIQLIKDKDPSVTDIVSVKLLSFTDSRCVLLLNAYTLVQLSWAEDSCEPELLSCCCISLPAEVQDTCADQQLCRGMLFLLTGPGLIYVFDSLEGRLLASIDLPRYHSALQSETEPAVSLSSFCLLQVSHDLSTLVATTSHNLAVAVDLNHYFRTHSDHLLCQVDPCHPPIKPLEPCDQDSLSNSAYTQSLLGTSFHTDRSWEAQLTSLYKKAKAPASQLPAMPWYRDLPHVECHRAAATAKLSHGVVPSGGAVMCFEVPERAIPATLCVSEFSAVLTFVLSGNSSTTVAFWDLGSGQVTYHRADGPTVPVQRMAEEEHLSLLLKSCGLSLVLFVVRQEELLNRLMVFGSASTVDSLCHLNAWDRCSIPIHALQAGLKNHQLDTVDFFLKSKENLLCPPVQTSTISTQTQLKNVRDMCPALNLLQSAIRDTHNEAQSRQFSEQLLNITLNFLNTQIRTVLCSSEELDANLQECVEVLDGYVTELRCYMKKFPWPGGSDSQIPVHSPSPAPDVTEEEEWQSLSTEEVVQRAVLGRQIAQAQAFLRRQGRPEQSLKELRRTGLFLALRCLKNKDLEQASALLRNMGFNVKEQLHSICLYTADQDLRNFVVEELRQQNYLADEEVEKVEFIKQIESLCTVPATRCSKAIEKSRVLQMRQSDSESKSLVQELTCDSEASSSQMLWASGRLDWVRHWDRDAQSSVLLSRLQDPMVCSCDPAVLWSYLTSIHDHVRITHWVQNLAAPTALSQWPALTADIVNNHTLCSGYMRDQILDLLARQGVFVQAETADFEQLLWRLGQAGGVMQENIPVPNFHSALGLDFHACFIQHCLEHGLRYLLYTYLEHYRLTPQNCPAVGDRSLYETYPWFEMMVKLQEITRHITDPEKVFQASLTSAQVLLPGSQASISSMLLEGHSLLALAAIMFAPGGIDQVVKQVERALDPLYRVDPQLLKMALSPYPKLKSALFPPSGSRGTSVSDVSVYHLMQSLHPLDPSRLFGWQSANTLGSSETSTDLPHFASPHLVNKYALVENLDFLYFLRHGRPSFAYGTFLVQHLVNSSNVKLQLSMAAEQAYHLGLLNFSVRPVAAACVCFCELLGVCSFKLRLDLRALNHILKLWSQGAEESSIPSLKQSLADRASKLVADERQTAEDLLVHLENAVRDRIERKGISRSSYEAGQEWALPVEFCHQHKLPLSKGYLQDCASGGHWLHFLLFVQLHSYPLQQVRALAAQFGPTLQAHLSLAFQDLQLVTQQKQDRSQAAEDSPEAPKELFQVLLQSQEQPCPWRYLLAEAVGQHCPPLSVLAACHKESDPIQCLCVWILTSVEDDITLEATTHIKESLRHHVWNVHDLSMIWKTLLKKSKIRPLIRGFQLFQRESPLIHMLHMYELCYDYKNYQEAKNKLVEFQKCLLNLRNSGVPAAEFISVQWVECQASVLLLTMMQQCGTQYELRRLLQLLADMERFLKSSGPDFKKLSLLSQILQDTPVCLSPCLLENYSTAVLQVECQNMLEQLQDLGLYSHARQVAELADLPIDSLIVNELVQELCTVRSKRQWERKETRVAFWRKCHEQFQINHTGKEAAYEFFLSQTKALDQEKQGQEKELLLLQERCLLLGLAGHWLSNVDPPPLDRLATLERSQWTCRMHLQVHQAAMEKESLFAVATPAGTAPEDSFEAILKEFSFSKMPALEDPAHLTLEALAASEEEEASQLDAEEKSALVILVGRLLDEGSIHEASRVCRYFRLWHRDLLLVLKCRGLAFGELQPGQQDLPSPDGWPRRSFPSSSSCGSLSSFVVVASPEDQVITQLQMLVDECCHGKSYCKQVLSLYELSKELECSYSEIAAEEPEAVLRKVLLSQQPERYKKAQAFISVQGLQPQNVAQLVSSAVVHDLLAASQEGEPAERRMFNPADGKDAFLQLAKLCGDPNLVGIKLLDSIPAVPVSELACTVEILILAHDCFSLTCNMEGIVRVLQAARHLSHTHLNHSEHYSLLVRLLTGIGRYNDMTYIFDLLNKNHRFEMLLRKKVESNTRLKTALLDYIKRCLPGDSEKHNMVALCFSMCREIGENHEGAARAQLKIIESQEWKVTHELKSALMKVLTLLKDAAESYSKDSCVRQAVRCVKMAKLVTLQLHLLNHGQDRRVINLNPTELMDAIMALPRCYQSFVVAEAYDYSPDWAKVLYQKVIVEGDFTYLDEFKLHKPLPASLFEDISKKVTQGKPAPNVSPNLKKLLQHCEDVYTHYKLAYEHKFFDVANMLLQDSYLSDRLGS